MTNRTMAILLTLAALAAFGCNRKKASNPTDVQGNMVYGSVECGDGENSLILGAVDNGSASTADSDGYVAQYDINTGVVAFTHLDLGAGEEPVRATRNSSGDVYVLGTSWDGSSRQIFLARFDRELELQWKITKTGTAEEGWNGAADLELDSNGNIWVCGSVEQSTSRHIWIAAYDSDGNLLGESLVREKSMSARDSAYRIQRSETNVFYVLGTQYEIPQYYLVSQPALVVTPSLAVSPSPVTTPVAPSIYVVPSPGLKLSPMDIWLGCFRLEEEEIRTVFEVTKDGSASSSYDRPVALDVDAAGRVFVGGVLANQDAGLDIWIAKFGQTEEPLWENTFDSSDSETPISDLLTDLQLDSNGDLFICGSFDGDIFVGKVDGEAGVLLWKDAQAGTFASASDQAIDLDVDSGGNLYVIGNVYEDDPGVNVAYQVKIWSCKYDTSGTRIFSAYKGSSLATFGMKYGASARAVTCDLEGRLLALGVVAKVGNPKAYLYDGLYRQDIWVASYSAEKPTWERYFSGTKTTAGIESSSTEVTSMSNAGGVFTDIQDGVHVYGDHDSQVTGRDGMYYVLDNEGKDRLTEPVRMNGFRDAEDRAVFGTWNN